MDLRRWIHAASFGLLVAAVGMAGACGARTGLDLPAGGDSGMSSADAMSTADVFATPDGASVPPSYIGREYYAVTMLNHLLDQSTFYFAVSLSNTGTSTAEVTFSGGAGPVAPVSIPAGQLKVITLPWVPALSCGVGPCCSNCQPTPPGTEVVANGAYHIESTEPITAYQFNAYQYAVGGSYSYTNDASLLIPVEAMTGNYRVAAWPTWNNRPGTIVVVGTQPATTVSVTAPLGTLQSSGGIGPNGGTVMLNAGDVLQMQSVLDAAGQTYGADVSGTLIAADKPVEVLGGHACSFIPAPVGYCDHLEQIALPIETLRGDYLVTPPYNANGGPFEWVKLLGVTDGTHVAFDPASVSAPLTLDAGQVVTLQAVAPAFRVHSTDMPERSFFVAQYMMGQDNFDSMCQTTDGARDCGDPSESVAVPTAQFRTGYQFVAPTSYTDNWVNVIAPSGASVIIDGASVTGFTSIGGSSGYDWTHVALSSVSGGVHNASSTQPFGIEVYGYGSYTSYMYPGGLNLLAQ